MNLYQLTSQHRALESLQMEETDEAALQAMYDTLDGLEGEIQVKAQSVAAHVLNIEAMATAAMDASKRLADRAKRIQRRAEAMRQYLHDQMQVVGLTKIDSPEFTLSIRKNPPSVQIIDDTRIPQEFWVQPPAPPPSIDKRAIGAQLKNGVAVSGCELAQSTRLEIKE
jgi:Siphovirus Gp157